MSILKKIKELAKMKKQFKNSMAEYEKVTTSG